MIYGYARVSSKTQANGNDSLEAREIALRKRGCQVVFRECFTGMTKDRPKFITLLGLLEKGDTLMVTKLDRFSRTAAEGALLVKELLERGIIIEILNMGRADNTPMGKLMVTMLLAFAEFEHDQIIERFNEGKAIAKTHGKKTEGRYKLELPEFPKYYEKTKSGEMSVVACCEALGISRSKWYSLCREVS